VRIRCCGSGPRKQSVGSLCGVKPYIDFFKNCCGSTVADPHLKSLLYCSLSCMNCNFRNQNAPGSAKAETLYITNIISFWGLTVPGLAGLAVRVATRSWTCPNLALLPSNKTNGTLIPSCSSRELILCSALSRTAEEVSSAYFVKFFCGSAMRLQVNKTMPRGIF
jgi:hypothetical protein